MYSGDSSHGEALAREFTEDPEGLRRLLIPLRTSLVGLSDADRNQRKVAAPKGRSNKDICKLAHDIARSDLAFAAMSRSEWASS